MVYIVTEWHKWVKVAAINCATQDSCNDFSIQGTPTIRIIYPQTPNVIGNYGVNIEASTAVPFWRSVVLHHAEVSQAKNVLPKHEMPNLLPLR